MPSVSSIFWPVPIIIFGGLVWFLADIKFSQRWSLKRAELGAQDKWRELNAHFEKALKWRRPMLLLFQRYVIPGLLEADYALHLSNQGEHERALVLAETASRKASRRPAVQLSVLPAQGTILLRLGRYAEAKQIVRAGRNLASRLTPMNKSLAPPASASIALLEGLIELYMGNLDAALRLGIEASEAAVLEPARALISGVLSAKGRFQEAVDALVYEPSRFTDFIGGALDALAHDPSGFVNPVDFETLIKDKGFCELAEKTDEEISGVFGPAANLGMALVFLDSGDAAKLGQALERTHSQLKSHQIIEHIFVRTRACWRAMQGDVAGVEADLTRTQQLTDEKPASRSAKYEYHLAAGRARYLLDQHATAIGELDAAFRLALHPMEKHVATYWLARASQAANQPTAPTLFKSVIADGFATWMEADSRRRTESEAG